MSNQKDNYWVPLSDLMTVLMVIFLFISISYMLDVKNKQAEKDKLFKDFEQTKIELLRELQTEFKDDFKKDKWDAVIDSADLSIKFVNEKVLFDYNNSDLKPHFQSVLTNFFPRYIAIILKPKYRNKIAEVRIEGHTDIQGDYIYNVELSQNRTRNVMKFLFGSPCYDSLDLSEKNRLKFWLTANGLSFGRTLDKNGQLTAVSLLQPDNEKCRRVEFKIVTTSEQLVREALKQMSK